MVEGEFFGRNPGIAVIAPPFGNAILPPLAFTQFTCGIALFAQLFIGYVGKNVHCGMMAQAGLEIQEYARKRKIYTGFYLFKRLKQQVKCSLYILSMTSRVSAYRPPTITGTIL